MKRYTHCQDESIALTLLIALVGICALAIYLIAAICIREENPKQVIEKPTRIITYIIK